MTLLPAFGHVLLSVDKHVASLTLNRSKVLNAASRPMLRELMLAMDFIENPASAVRSVLITGAGRAFCAGVDLTPSENRWRKQWAARWRVSLEYYYHPFIRRLRGLEVPVVVAVNGAAVGVGASIALMATRSYARAAALFSTCLS